MVRAAEQRWAKTLLLLPVPVPLALLPAWARAGAEVATAAAAADDDLAGSIVLKMGDWGLAWWLNWLILVDWIFLRR